MIEKVAINSAEALDPLLITGRCCSQPIAAMVRR